MVSPFLKCTTSLKNNQNSELVIIKEHINTIEDYVHVYRFKSEEVLKLTLPELSNLTSGGYEPVYLRSVSFQ